MRKIGSIVLRQTACHRFYRQCQRLDWRVHRRECAFLKDENALAEALSEMNPAFRSQCY